MEDHQIIIRKKKYNLRRNSGLIEQKHSTFTFMHFFLHLNRNIRKTIKMVTVEYLVDHL